MRPTTFIVAAVAGMLQVGAASAAAQTPDRVLQLSFDTEGRVTLRAQHVTVREILAEWSRQCGCYLVNAEKLTGGPVMVPLLFEQQPQSVVLTSLLRQAAGYVLTPRRAGATGPSQYEVIYILATSHPTAGAFVPQAPSMPMPAPISTPGSPNNEIPPVAETPAPAPPGQAPKPMVPGYPATGVPSPFVVPIVPAPSSPFSPPTPPPGGGPGTSTPGTSTPGQPTPPGGTVGANP
jgi:hypothetical protein